MDGSTLLSLTTWLFVFQHVACTPPPLVSPGVLMTSTSAARSPWTYRWVAVFPTWTWAPLFHVVHGFYFSVFSEAKSHSTNIWCISEGNSLLKSLQKPGFKSKSDPKAPKYFFFNSDNIPSPMIPGSCRKSPISSTIRVFWPERSELSQQGENRVLVQ